MIPGNVFATADHHFGHGNIIKFCDRPFADALEMDRALVERWNAAVGPEDVVYHLGDFTLRDSPSPWLDRLNFGQLYFVPGGHDHRWLKRFQGQAVEGRWVEVLPPLVTLEFPSGGKRPHVVVLCHYPMLSWDRSHYGSLHCHGHSHGAIPDSLSGDEQLPPGERKGFRIDVGVDCWDFAPVRLARLFEMAGKA